MRERRGSASSTSRVRSCAVSGEGDRLLTGERVLGVWRDKMDLRSVRVYAIERAIEGR